jgi:post-segregation antitoxin (ccd killing protein)
MRTSVSVDDGLAAEARELGINVSEAARDGLRRAIRRARAERDRQAYLSRPEVADDDWDAAESWGEV